MGMFSKDGVTIREGAAALRIISLGFVVSGISVVASGALEALGEGIPSFIISLLRYLVLIVPVASIGSRIFGITGVSGCVPGGRSADCSCLSRNFYSKIPGVFEEAVKSFTYLTS